VALEEKTRRREFALSGRTEADAALSARSHRGKRVLLATLAAAVGVAGVAFWAGTAVRGGAGALPAHVTEPAVTVPVVGELLVDGVQGSGTVALPAGNPVAPLSPQLSAPGAQPIVTGLPWHVGSRVGAGDLLVEVAGEPIFLLSGSTPAYRDLRLGDTGKDVAELQNALRGAGFAVGDSEATYGQSTAAAVASLYRAHGYTAPMSGTVSVASAKGVGGMRAKPSGAGGAPKAAMLPVWSAIYVKHLPATVSAVHGGIGARVSGARCVDPPPLDRALACPRVRRSWSHSRAMRRAYRSACRSTR
jgi:hypothetical protein